MLILYPVKIFFTKYFLTGPEIVTLHDVLRKIFSNSVDFVFYNRFYAKNMHENMPKNNIFRHFRGNKLQQKFSANLHLDSKFAHTLI